MRSLTVAMNDHRGAADDRSGCSESSAHFSPEKFEAGPGGTSGVVPQVANKVIEAPG